MKKYEPFDLDELEEVCTIGEKVTVPAGKTGMWHVFTNNTDEFFGLDQEAEARELFDTWAKEEGCARLYLEIEDEDGNNELEECWQSVGDYPM